MTVRIAALAATLLATAPAFALGTDSARSPYPASAYSGVVTAPAVVGTHSAPAAYRYAGQHAGGPANDVVRR